ncbi:MAG: permease [Bacteroidales bacterium]|nr:permease [Bacteroidales bacterium]
MLVEYISEFFSELLVLLQEMAPYLLIGFLFAGILKVFFPKRLIKKYIGGSDLRSVVNASVFGVPLPLCSCGVLPTGISFYKSGASRGSTVSFLVSTPQTGIDSIIATYAMLGLPLAILRPVIALFSGILGGVFTNYAGGAIDRAEHVKNENGGNGDKSVREMLRYGFVEMVQDISKWLIIGFFLAALLSVLIPDDFFVETIRNEYLSMLLILIASIPLYVCATGSIPIAAVLLMKGLSPGAAIVFLMAGPATNAATMAVINNTMGRRTFWMYLISIIGGALLFGMLVNELIPRDWIMSAVPDLHHEGHHEGSNIIKLLSGILLTGLIINGYIQKYLSRKSSRKDRKNTDTMSDIQVYRVEGMTCNHCKATVENGIREIDENGEVFADPSKNELRIATDEIPEDEIKKKIESLGYIFKGKK